MKNLLWKTKLIILIGYLRQEEYNDLKSYLWYRRIQHLADSFPFIAYMGMSKKQINNLRF